ncbi:MAG: UDP-N-acetylmuramate--L-alanine ligase [Firmicutes bacterium]|nr:UDP-N-acetylmuramate--L-alanine ligase [Bacillota bacterium]
MVLDKINRVHFIGAGGISMSSLAKLMLMKGKKVTGSDLSYSAEVVTLNQWGADIWIGHEPKKVLGADLVVYTMAIPDTDEELIFARENGIPTVARHMFLKEISYEYETVIAVAGTHGKTTATGMIASVLNLSGLPFTAHIGGNIAGGIGNMIFKGNRYFVTEACEYKKSLLQALPDIAIILNVEEDHPDTYATVGELYDTFDKFVGGIKQDGSLIIFGDSEYYQMMKCTPEHMITYGYEGTLTYVPMHITEHKLGCYKFIICHNGEPECEVTLNVAGKHNIYNALASYASLRRIGIEPEVIAKGLKAFKGVERRFELKGEINGAQVIVDYAHHPREISATVATALSFKPKKLITVFQPHTFSRTKKFFHEFIKSLEESGVLHMFKEYPARENISAGASAKELFVGIVASGKQDASYFDNTIDIATEIMRTAERGDIVLILGAGDIVNLADVLVERY